jgi:hypothetical protein
MIVRPARGKVGADPVTEPRQHSDDRDRIVPDLVEYLVVAVPDVGSLGALADALVQIVDSAAIRILDLVVLVKDRAGLVTTLELDAVECMAPLRGMPFDHLLSEHDIGLAALALQPDTAAVVLVTEDRWAAPLSTAAQYAGGRIVGGERISASTIEAALTEQPDTNTTGGGS